ncbi:MafI family immunity protein [Providencia burhodogranariea]|uniref:MafI family immunity protein n=1 Tax=Providencia burhodogranariea DSM 19968 TaxID=1141662 RepID=K8WVH1_9GAMM|nr:MafI family immunity protein [Providencia burhodogranariea]EKT64598.1 hypothetical protein OOA_02337 [Providencia burhodogranariea DSM 19968]
MDIKTKISRFGEGLKGRLEPSIIDYDLEYIGNNEIVLAFEMLCDHIANYNVKLRQDEYNQIICIVNELKLDLNERYQYINPERNP